MSRKRILLPLILSAFAISCLKAKRSPFDVSSKSPASNLIVGRALTSTNTASSSTSSSTVPATITYGGSGTYRMIPGNPVNYTPTFSGTVESWSITPDLKSLVPELTFDPKTGSITGTPSTPLALTTFTITAKNGNASKEFTIQLEVLKSGDNVWTVINGVNGAHTSGQNSGLAFDSNSNSIYMIGTTQGNLNGEVIPSTGGYNSAFLSKFDLDGNRIWTRIFGISGTNSTDVQGIVIDSSGNIYVSGVAQAGNINGLNITVGGGNVAGFIIKYDKNGNQLWINSSAPSIRHDSGGVVIDSSGNILFGAIVRATALHQTNNSWADAGTSVVKYDGNTGAYISSIMISSATGTFRGIEVNAIATDSSNNVYLAVSTRSLGYCGSNTTFYNPALIRLDSNLAYLGCTALTSPGGHSFAFGLKIASGGVYMSGYVGGTNLNGQARVGTMDGYLAKFDTTGGLLWLNLLGVASKVTVVNSIGFASGFVYASGMTHGDLLGKTIGNTQKDMFVVKYTAVGAFQWINYQGIMNDTSPCSGQGCFSSITFDSNNTLYTSGTTNGTIGGIANPAGSYNSVFLVRNVQ